MSYARDRLKYRLDLARSDLKNATIRLRTAESVHKGALEDVEALDREIAELTAALETGKL